MKLKTQLEIMTANTHPYEALFKIEIEGKPGKYYYERRPIIAWDNSGNPLVPGKYSLVPAHGMNNFYGIDESNGGFIGVLPGGGYRAQYKNQDGSLWSEPILAWAINHHGQATPITTDSDGITGDATALGNFEAILDPPEENKRNDNQPGHPDPETEAGVANR